MAVLARLILGGVFLYAGGTKAFDPGGLAASIRSYQLALPEAFVTLAAYSLPWIEILIGFYLLIGLFTRISAWMASGLLVVFMFAILQGALRGLEIDCGCFGTTTGGAANLWVDVARDLGLLALGLYLAYGRPGRFSVDAKIHRRGS